MRQAAGVLIVTLLISGCGGDSSSDGDREEAATSPSDAPLPTRLPAEQADELQGALEHLQISQGSFGVMIVNCAALAELAEPTAEKCFQRGGKISDTDGAFRRAVEDAIDVVGASGAAVRGPCREALRVYLRSFLPYARTASKAQVAGARGDLAAFVEHAGRVTRLSPIRRAQVRAAASACASDPSSVIPDGDPSGDFVRLVRVDAAQNLIDANLRCGRRLASNTYAAQTCDVIHVMTQCVQHSTGFPEMIACHTQADLGGLREQEAQWKEWERCINDLGAGTGPPRDCELPPG